MSDNAYRFLRELVYERSRINLGPDKQALVSARVAKRLRALKMSSYEEYCRWLKTSADEDELARLVDVISTNHTQFFREEQHFKWLQTELLPRWREPKRHGEMLRAWSAACSSGEEPYTLAIVLAEFFDAAPRWTIHATDISTRVLASAQKAVYSEEKLSSVRPELLRRYFQRGAGKWEGCYRVKDTLRQAIHFQHLNLFQAGYPFNHRFHVIFCRNVMIYFDRPTQETLIAKLTDQLEPGGCLLVGHSETLGGIQHTLRQAGPAIYLKQG